MNQRIKVYYGLVENDVKPERGRYENPNSKNCSASYQKNGLWYQEEKICFLLGNYCFMFQ